MKHFLILLSLLFSVEAFAQVKADSITTNNPSLQYVTLLRGMDFTVNTGIYLPAGTTAQRPSPSKNGMLRYNTSFDKVEAYVAGSWTQFAGDVAGPGSSTDNAIARFDSTSGKIIQNSGASVDDSGNIAATNFTGSSSGTNTGDQTITLTGDVTGSGTGSFATAIGAGKVTNSMLAGSIDASTKFTNATPIANGGTGATSKTAGFDALSPMSASGDIIYGGTSGTGTRLAKGSDGQMLMLDSGIPAWSDRLLVEAHTSSTPISGSSATTQMTFSTETWDPQNLFVPGTGTFSCNKTMTLKVSGSFLSNTAASATAGSTTFFRLRRGTTNVKNMDIYIAPATGSILKKLHGHANISCVNGDTVNIAIENPDSAMTGVGTEASTWITIERIK